jgi:hypothetical protein
MKVKSKSATDAVLNGYNALSKMLKESRKELDVAGNVWTDSMRKKFFTQYMSIFTDVQEKTLSNLNSIYLTVKDIESNLK